MIRGKVTLRPEAIERVKSRLSAKRKNLQQYRISVGIHEEEGAQAAIGYDGKPGSLSLVEVALIQEFGGGNVPERSYLRSWFDQNIARMRRESSEAMRLELAGQKGVVEQQSARWAEELREWVRSGSADLVSLSPGAQVAREREGLEPDPPLDATGQLVKAISVIVESRS